MSVGIYFYESRGQMKILPRSCECSTMYCTDTSVIRDLLYCYACNINIRLRWEYMCMKPILFHF